jgi:hypothetical protein
MVSTLPEHCMWVRTLMQNYGAYSEKQREDPIFSLSTLIQNYGATNMVPTHRGNETPLPNTNCLRMNINIRSLISTGLETQNNSADIGQQLFTGLDRSCNMIWVCPCCWICGHKFLATDPEVWIRFPVLPDFWVVGLERGPLSLASTIAELLERKSSGSSLENWECGHSGSTTLTTRHPSIRKIWH